METRLVYMTADSLEEAREIGRILVSERLAACANITPGMTSVYWWDGEVQNGEEVIVIAKTRADLVDVLTERVRAIHSYSCPCVVSLPIDGGNSDFLDWIAQETADAPPMEA